MTVAQDPASQAPASAEPTSPLVAPPEPPAPSAARAADEPPARRKRRPFAVLATIVAVILALAGGYRWMTAGQESTDDAQIAADMVPVGTRVAGQVLRVMVGENRPVKKGEPLVELDRADYEAKLAQAEAEVATAAAQAAAADAQVRVVEATSKGGLASARAAVSGSSVGVSSADAQIEAAKASLSRAETEARRAETDLRRAKELRAANALPQERLDNAQSTAESAQAALAQARAQLVAATEGRRAAQSRVQEAEGRLTQSGPIDAQIAAARASADIAHARVKSIEAALTLAKLQLSYTRIDAPFGGVASKLAVHEGQLVGVGQTVVEVVPAATYVIANFKETQVGKIRPGQRAEVRVDAFPGQPLEGTVESLSSGTGASFSLLPADNASGNFVKVVQRVAVRVAWKSPPALPLRAGMSADVLVYADK